MAGPQEALARIALARPDVAILDIGMPGMDGFALATALRQAAPDWSGRLVALTGYGQESDKTKAREAGFALHLTKPADIAALLAAVESLVRAPSSQPPSARAAQSASPGANAVP